MKKFNDYTSKEICSKDVVSDWISTLRPSIQVWDDFVDEKKIEGNLHAIKFYFVNIFLKNWIFSERNSSKRQWLHYKDQRNIKKIGVHQRLKMIGRGAVLSYI